MLAVEPGQHTWTGERVAKLADNFSHSANPGGVVCSGLGAVVCQPTLKLTNRNSEQFGQSLLGRREGVGRSGKDVAHWRAVVVRPIFNDVTQCVPELLKRDTNIPTLVATRQPGGEPPETAVGVWSRH